MVAVLTGCVPSVSENEAKESFEVNMPVNDAYEAVLRYLKIKGYTFESASKETGQIFTNMFDEKAVILFREGSKLEVVLIDNGNKTTTAVVSARD